MRRKKYGGAWANGYRVEEGRGSKSPKDIMQICRQRSTTAGLAQAKSHHLFTLLALQSTYILVSTKKNSPSANTIFEFSTPSPGRQRYRSDSYKPSTMTGVAKARSIRMSSSVPSALLPSLAWISPSREQIHISIVSCADRSPSKIAVTLAVYCTWRFCHEVCERILSINSARGLDKFFAIWMRLTALDSLLVSLLYLFAQSLRTPRCGDIHFRLFQAALDMHCLNNFLLRGLRCLP